MADKLLSEDPFTFFTSNIDFGILQMRNYLKETMPAILETTEDIVFDVIHEFCENMRAQLINYIIEFRLLHEFDILYLRRRNIFTNESLSKTLSFLHKEFYATIPQSPSFHCLNLCFVNADQTIVPYFYMKRPPPPRSERTKLLPLIREECRQVGAKCYMIHKTWFNSWRHDSNPGPIDNIPNVDTVTLNGLNCEIPNYHFISELAWCYLIAWYGILGCKLGIRRYIMKDSFFDYNVPESTPDDIWCFLYPNDVEFKIIKQFSRDGIDQIKLKVKHVYSVRPHIGSRLYSRSSMESYSKWKLLGDTNADLDELSQNGAVMLVTQDKQHNWPDPNKRMESDT